MLLWKFRLADQGSSHEQWVAVWQFGLVADYCLEFVGKPDIWEKFQKHNVRIFINGLDESVKRELRVHGPLTIESTMDWVIKIATVI